jgi:membrane protease YdiL (CAAX protease family)
LPNPLLTAVTLAGGVVLGNVYQRVPNLFALAVSHSIMTWLVVSTMPQSALYHLRVGLRYFS